MTLREIFRNLNDRFFRAAALREARAEVVNPEDGRARALLQARLLIEAGRRVVEPVEAFPPGSRPAVLLSLYRDAVYWALVAGRSTGGDAPADLKTLWAGMPPPKLLQTARDSVALEALKNTLVQSGPVSLDATDEDATRARALAESLVSDLDASRRRVERILGQRWSRIVLCGAAALLLGFGVRVLALGPNLAAGKPFRTSSSWSGCATDPPCADLLFHTDNESNPWVEFDLGAPKTIHRIEVSNRTDCCGERAVPLLAEVSGDRAHWVEVGRRESEFSSWTAKFSPKTARYVRLRVPRQTVLHFKAVAVR